MGANVPLGVVPWVVGAALAGVEVVAHAEAVAHLVRDGLSQEKIS